MLLQIEYVDYTIDLYVTRRFLDQVRVNSIDLPDSFHTRFRYYNIFCMCFRITHVVFSASKDFAWGFRIQFSQLYFSVYSPIRGRRIELLLLLLYFFSPEYSQYLVYLFIRFFSLICAAASVFCFSIVSLCVSIFSVCFFI